MKLLQFVFFNLTLFAVINAHGQKKELILEPTKSGTELIYDFAEIEPEFPGGKDSLDKWIVENFNPPASTSEEKIKIRVYARFEVLKTGRVVSPRIVRGYNEQVEQEIIRMLKTMPYWTPGKVKNKTVIVRYVLPIDLTFYK